MEPPPRPYPNAEMSDGYTTSSSSSRSRPSTAPSSAPSVYEQDWQDNTFYPPPEPSMLTADKLQLQQTTMALGHESHQEPVFDCSACIQRHHDEQFFPKEYKKGMRNPNLASQGYEDAPTDELFRTATHREWQRGTAFNDIGTQFSVDRRHMLGQPQPPHLRHAKKRAHGRSHHQSSSHRDSTQHSSSQHRRSTQHRSTGHPQSDQKPAGRQSSGHGSSTHQTPGHGMSAQDVSAQDMSGLGTDGNDMSGLALSGNTMLDYWMSQQ